MASFTVGAPGTLEEVLGWNGIQRWRAEYLVVCGGVTATRGRVSVNLNVGLGETPMLRGDIVNVPDPEPPKCAYFRHIIAVSRDRYRDYAMVGTPLSKDDPHIPRLSKFFALKPQTVLLPPPGGSIKEFVEALKGDPAIAFPIRDLMLGAHAAPIGSVAVPVWPHGVPDMNFERLEEAERFGVLKIDPKLLEPRPTDASDTAVPPRFVIRGCGVGAALPFLQKLKQALGGALSVVAPKFEHAAGSFDGPTGAGLYEFLAYEFVLGRPKRLQTFKEVLEAFMGGGFTDFTGAAIPPATWATWIPRGSPPPDRHERKMFGSDLARRTLVASAFFTVVTEQFPGGPVRVNAQTDPGTDAARLIALGAHLGAQAVYQASHPFPFFRRLGYPSLSALLAGHAWSFRHDPGIGKLICTGSTVVYTVHQPIADAKGKLIHNFFPTRPAGPPQEMFTDRDARFFAAV